MFDLVIVGGGPTSVYMLDAYLRRIISQRKNKTSAIAVVNKTKYFGCGLHYLDTPCMAKLNRIAGQISLCSVTRTEDFLSDEICKLGSYFTTFVEWCDYKYRTTMDKKYNVTSTDWPPRALFGEAMVEQFANIKHILFKLGVSVDLFVGEALLSSHTSPVSVIVNSRQIHAKKILLACGATGVSRSYNSIYPLQRLDKDIEAYDQFRVIGGGPSSIDVCKYIFSNKPDARITISTRSGNIGYSRAVNQKVNQDDFYKCKYVNRNLILSLIESTKDVDTDECLDNLFTLEFLASALTWSGYDADQSDHLKTSEDVIRAMEGLEEKLNKVVSEKQSVKLEAYFKKIELEFGIYHNVNTRKSFVKSVLNIYSKPYMYFGTPDDVSGFMQFDLFNSKLGNLDSIFKYITDGVFRDGRSNIMSTLETDIPSDVRSKIHGYILKKYLPVHNRVADGCDLQSIEFLYREVERKKLIIIRSDESQNHEANSDPNVYKIVAIVNLSDSKRDGLTKKLSLPEQLSEKKYRSFQYGENATYDYGLALDERFRLIIDGLSHPDIYVLGAGAEGIRIFNHTLARSDSAYPVIRNINLVCNEFF
jgi:hypothetical protein